MGRKVFVVSTHSAPAVITIVSGLPRSGTSMMMGMLHAGGLPAWTDHRRVADADNRWGYFEHEAVRRLADDASWLPQARGRAVKVIYRLLPWLPNTERYRIVFMHRPLRAVLRSQERFLLRRNLALGERRAVHAAYVRELCALWAYLAQLIAVPVLHVPYLGVCQNPTRWAEHVRCFVGQPLRLAEMARAVHAPRT